MPNIEIAQFIKDAVEKDYELVGTTYEFAKTLINKLEVYSRPVASIKPELWDQKFKALQECIFTLMQSACENINSFTSQTNN